MDYLPQDPAMMVSAINMLLRDDEFDTLESLCNYFDKEPALVKAYLQEHGYIYSEEQRQFRPADFDKEA